MAALSSRAPASYVVVVSRATGLRSADFMGKSDPYVVVGVPGQYRGKTTVVQNNLDPIWSEAFFVVGSSVELTVFDSDAGTFVDGSDDLLGAATLRLEGVGRAWSSKSLALGGHPKAKGTLEILVRQYSDPHIAINNAKGLRNADGMFGVSDPYVKVTGILPSPGKSDGSGRLLVRTATVQNSLNPVSARFARVT